jgi:hypothetical protein
MSEPGVRLVAVSVEPRSGRPFDAAFFASDRQVLVAERRSDAVGMASAVLAANDVDEIAAVRVS